MTSITREQLVSILDEKLAPFKQAIDDLCFSVEEANKFVKFACKQYDEMFKEAAACEAEMKQIRSENRVHKKTN